MLLLGVLMVIGKEVEMEIIDLVVLKFLDWFIFFKNVILIVYNGKNLDFFVFMIVL